MSVTKNHTPFLYISISTVIHIVVVVLIFFVKGFEWKINPQSMNVVHSSVRVDVVEMPKFTVAELKRMQQQAGDSEISEELTTIAPPAKTDILIKKKKVNFMALMNNLSKKKVEKAKHQKKRKARKQGQKFGKFSGDLKKIMLAGNKLNKGKSIVGGSAGISDGVFSNYIQSLPDQVRMHWKLPSYLLNKKLRCRIRIFLNEQGVVLRSDIIESSGEKEFDARAQKAIVQSQPFPKIDPEILSRVVRGDIILGFPL